MRVLDYPKATLRVEWRLIRLPYTLYEALQRTNEGNQSRDDDARRTFIEDLVGRVKGVAGLVMGNDEMIARGQVDRAKAALRLDGIVNESVANRRDQAADEKLAERKNELRAQKSEIAEQEASRVRRASRKASVETARLAGQVSSMRSTTKRLADTRREDLKRADRHTHAEYAKNLDNAAAEKRAARAAKRQAAELKAIRKA